MKKVVIVDDEPFILMMVEDKLKRAGLEVIALRDSTNAYETVKSQRPDLVILDWMMPQHSGIEVLRAIKGDSELKDIPVFMLTAKVQEEEEKMGLKAGVVKYITKPFSPRLLLDEVKKTIGLDED